MRRIFIVVGILLTAFVYRGASQTKPDLQRVFQERCEVSGSSQLCPKLHEFCCCKNKLSTESDAYYESRTIVERVVFCAFVKEVPGTFPNDTRQIIFDHSKLEELSSSSFKAKGLHQVTFFQLIDDETINTIGDRTFTQLSSLGTIYIQNARSLTYISESAFYNLHLLRKIYLKSTGLKMIHGFTELGNTFRAEPLHIAIMKNKWLTRIQGHAFRNLSEKVSSIQITFNPALTTVEDFAFEGSWVRNLKLNDNPVLTDFTPKAFAGMHNLQKLFFQNTQIRSLPTMGLENLRSINATNTPQLLRFPKLPNLRKAWLTYPYHCCALNEEYGFKETFENEESEEPLLYYCDTGEALSKPKKIVAAQPQTEESELTDVYHNNESSGYQFDNPYSNYSGETYGVSDYLMAFFNFSSNVQDSNSENSGFVDDVDSAWEDGPVNTSIIPSARSLCMKHKNGTLIMHFHRESIQCFPKTDDFSPCENLLGSEALANFSWLVAILALFGNFFVVIALLLIAFHKSRLSVPKFLILNLAFADFCMGIYLFALTIMDAKTKDSYYKYGVEWQILGGCDVIGFFAVFASQLSIYTLSVISLERWYAIRNAIRLDMRMTLKCSQAVMVIGWLVSIVLATLPLTGINSYRKTAICLPMDVEKISGQVYIVALLWLDIVAFLIVLVSYVWMYAIVRTANNRHRNFIRKFFRLQQKRDSEDGKSKRRNDEACYSPTEQTVDRRIAKKMAVLVFTDFACFFPIAFFTLFAIAGHSVVSISKAKILLIFCFPLNACANPLLYAILTRSFIKDVRSLMKLMKRICVSGDSRPKAASNQCQTRKPSASSDLREQRRKTLHVVIDAEVETQHGDGSVSAEHKSVSGNSKVTYLKLNSNSSTGNSRCSSVSARSSISKATKSAPKACDELRKCSSHSLGNPILSENLRGPSRRAFARLFGCKFWRAGKTVPKHPRKESAAPSFETNTTAACDARPENELLELYNEQSEVSAFITANGNRNYPPEVRVNDSPM